MRIVGGRFGGRVLPGPKGTATRPTAERVREAIASVLDARDGIVGARVLELYAGTGALGFEMLSRGAERALFVERDPKVARLIRENASELSVEDRSEVLCEDVTRTRAEEAILARGPFSLVLADPPYRDVQRAVDAIARMMGRGMLDSDACLLLEHGSKDAPVLPSEFAVLSSYRYGDTTVVLCRATPLVAGAGS